MLQEKFLSYLLVAIGLFCHSAVASEKDVSKIYVVDSYNPASFQWTQQIFGGIEAGLKQNGYIPGENISIERYTLDAYVNKSEESRQKIAESILEHLVKKPPDYLICTDDDAIKWVCLKHSLDIPTILNGINGDPRKYISKGKIRSMDQPGHHITGIYQTSYFSQSLLLLKQIIPEAKNFAVFTDETTTGTALLDSLKKVVPTELALQWTKTLISSNLEDWIATVKQVQKNREVDAVLILSSNALVNSQGRLLSVKESLVEFQQHSVLPEIGSWEFQVEAGMMLSAADSGHQQGLLTALYLDQIEKGKSVGEMPFTSPANGVPAINVARVKQLNLEMPQSLVNTIIESGVAFE